MLASHNSNSLNLKQDTGAHQPVKKQVLLLLHPDNYRKCLGNILKSFSDWELLSASSIREGLDIVAWDKLDAIVMDSDFMTVDMARTIANASVGELPIFVLDEDSLGDFRVEKNWGDRATQNNTDSIFKTQLKRSCNHVLMGLFQKVPLLICNAR